MDNLQQILRFLAVACSAVHEICTPLYKTGITNFVYVRIYPDKTRFYLSNNFQWSKHFYNKFYSHEYKETYFLEESLQHNLLVFPEHYYTNPIVRDGKEIFDIKNTFILPLLHANYKEICYFASVNSEPTMYNYYLNNIETLTKFVSYFKEKATALINTAHNYKSSPPPIFFQNSSRDFINYLLTTDFKYNFLNEIKTDKFYLPFDPKGRYLTNKEFECISWYVKGKSADEIGIISGLSRRTVEKYLENLKNKFSCSKIPQLIYILTRLGLIVH